MTWKDVTAYYAGVFFRAGGGEAAAFGTVQQDNSRFVNVIKKTYNSADKYTITSDNITIPLRGSSRWIFTGGDRGSNIYFKFESFYGEVRPKNMAVKIWRRDS